MTVLSKEEVIRLTKTFENYMKQDATPFQFTNEKGESISYFLQRGITPKEKKELEHILRRLFPSDKTETGYGRCNCCTKRGLLLGSLIDDTGKPILLKNFNEDKENKSECPYHDLYSYLIELHKKKDATYTIYIVSDDTTPEKDDGKEPHFYYTPSHTTEKNTAKKFDLLIEKYINQGGMMFQRMDKYMSETMKQDVPFLLTLIDKVNIHAQNVFTNPLKWLNGCLIKLDGRTWERLSLIEKLHICVYAMITGSSDSNVHYGFQTSEQLLDFSKDGKSEDAVIRWMNASANPEIRQVSSISQKLEVQSVKSNVWIGLTWDGVISFDGKMYVVDFDIQVICPNGQKICFSYKRNSYAKLNFDANEACNPLKLEENPSECVTIIQSGNYTVYVHMWGYKEKGSPKPVINYPPPGVVLHFPFNIIIHNHGHEQIIPGVWNSANNGSVAMEIGTYDINIENPPDATMSEKEACKYLHKMPDFVKDIGDSLTSNVVDLSTVPKEKILYSSTSPALRHSSVSASASPLSILTQMASASLSASASSKKSTSGSLADRCSSVPKTTTELLETFKRNPNSTMEVNLRDFTPSYITQIGGIKVGALRDYKAQIINTYCDGNGMPREPVLGQGDAQVSRFDEEWSLSGNTYIMTASVRAIIEQNGFPFFVLNGMKLPSVSSEKWSLVGGFYPTSLSVDNHKHKSAFTSMNTLVKPIVDGENPLIGFIPPTNYKLKLNGREINLKHD